MQKQFLPEKNREWLAASVLSACAVIAIVFFLPLENTAPVLPNPLNSSERIHGCVDLNRESYGLTPAVFENLPVPPNCFVSVVQAYREQKFSDNFFFTPDFFLQPEFFASFEKNGLEYWKNPVATHWGVVGFGAFPTERALSIRPGQTIRTRFFFHSGFGVRTFQGVRLEPEWQGGIPAGVEIGLDENSATGFLLGPAFPKFGAHWAKAVDVTVRALPFASSGDFSLVLKTKAPSESQKMQWQETLLRYFDATQFVGELPAMRLRLRVG